MLFSLVSILYHCPLLYCLLLKEATHDSKERNRAIRKQRCNPKPIRVKKGVVHSEGWPSLSRSQIVLIISNRLTKRRLWWRQQQCRYHLVRPYYWLVENFLIAAKFGVILCFADRHDFFPIYVSATSAWRSVLLVFQGDLEKYLQVKGRLSPAKVLRFALDIARWIWWAFSNLSQW